MTQREYSAAWRRKQNALGKCCTCGAQKERPALSLCDSCLDTLREAALVRYRARKGIPLNKPLDPRGRPRGPRKPRK